MKAKIHRWGIVDNARFMEIYDQLKKSKGTVVLENRPNMFWLVACINSAIVGCAAIWLKQGNARYKCDIVDSSFRGQGIYQELFQDRIKYTLQLGTKTADAFASPYSVKTFERHGFVKIREIATSSTWYVKNENLWQAVTTNNGAPLNGKPVIST